MQRRPSPLSSAVSSLSNLAFCNAFTLSEDELVTMIFLPFGAGQETTTHLISGRLFACYRMKINCVSCGAIQA